MERFEYMTIFTDAKGMLGGKADESAFADELNKLGKEGWELISCAFPPTRIMVQHATLYQY